MNNILRNLWYYMSKYVFIILPNKLFFNLNGFVDYTRFGKRYKWMNISHPETFNEHINYLKLHPTATEGALLADKYRVRDYIMRTIGGKYLVPLLATWQNANDIDFDTLPAQFVIKANHGSGWNLICEDKSKLSIPKARRKLNGWLRKNGYYIAREWQYKNIEPLLVCEKFLGHDINDCKFFCFNGKPEFMQIDINKHTNHTRAFYDMSWNKLLFSTIYPLAEEEIEKPVQFEEMKEIAQKLCKNYSFVRIDLLIKKDRIYFSEITLHPGGGTSFFMPLEYDRIIGEIYMKNS